jgi:osmotically-inducible protein OsmY
MLGVTVRHRVDALSSAVVNEMHNEFVKPPVASPADHVEIDAAILASVRAALVVARAGALADVDVHVLHAWVTLSGAVPSAVDKHAAGEIAANVTGVRGVSNALSIRGSIDHEALNAAIRTAAIRAVLDDVRGICVELDGDQVTLRGMVQSWRLYEAAERAVARLPGVRAVQNHLVVNLRKYLPTPESYD